MKALKVLLIILVLSMLLLTEAAAERETVICDNGIVTFKLTTAFDIDAMIVQTGQDSSSAKVFKLIQLNEDRNMILKNEETGWIMMVMPGHRVFISKDGSNSIPIFNCSK